MRSLILLCTIGFLSSVLSAQTFEVVSTYPEDGAFGVLTDSILITFSEPVFLDIEIDDLEESGFYAGLEPEDDFEPDSIALSEDGLTVKFFGSFEDDTDFLLYIMGAVSESGKELHSPVIVQFTTADARGEFVIRGYLDDWALDQLEINDFHGFTAILTYSPPEFFFFDSDDEHGENGNNGEGEASSYTSIMKNYITPFISINEEDIDEGDQEGEGDIIPVYATIVDANTGEFEITGVREGVYFPLGYNLFEIAEFEEFDENSPADGVGFFFPTTLRYDADGDLGIDSIIVNSTEVPTDTLSNINLTLIDLHPITLNEALGRAYEIIGEEASEEWEIRGGFTEYKLADFIFFDDSNEEKSTVSDINTTFTQLVDGTSLVWNLISINESIDSVAVFALTPISFDVVEELGQEDVDPETVFSEIRPIPSDALDSDAAFEIMLEEGLTAAFNEMESVFGFNFFWDFELQLFHEYWNFTPDPDSNIPLMWKGTLYGSYYDYGDDYFYEAEYVIFLDAVTGELTYDFGTPVPNVETFSLTDYEFPEGEVNPAGDSLVFHFNSELELDLLADDPEEIGFLIFIEPEDSVEITGFNYEAIEGGSIVKVFVDLTEDTDYIVFLAEVNGANGEVLDQPYILQFTTGDESNRFTISGYLETPDIDINNFFKNMIVMLVEEEPDFGFDFFGEDEDFEESDSVSDNHGDEDENDFIPLYAANVDSESGYFEISLIREGNYYPVAFDVTDDGDEGEFEEFYIPKIYYYDSNEDRFPDILEINSSTAPSDTLGDLELAALSFDRFTLSEAIELVQLRIDDLGIGEVEFMGGATFFQFYGFEEMSYVKGLNNFPTAIITDHDSGPLGDPFFMKADGRNFIWEIFVYHPAKDSALATYVSPVGAYIEGYFGEDDIEDPIEFDDLKLLPENYIDSDSAAYRFAEEGGDAFVEFLEDTYEPGSYYWYHDIQALHEYWDYPFGASPDQPVAWKATYESYAYDNSTGTEYVDSLIIYLDVSTGNLLFTELHVDSELELDTPQRIQLGQNYPNPFNPSTNIPFELSQTGVVNIEIFNLLGQKVATLTNELYSAGRHTIAWNASNYSSGIYFYRLTAGDVIQTKKLMLIK